MDELEKDEFLLDNPETEDSELADEDLEEEVEEVGVDEEEL
ncbi:MAG: hypothetical protein AAB919_00690 [Patescibacteria group bacterium]